MNTVRALLFLTAGLFVAALALGGERTTVAAEPLVVRLKTTHDAGVAARAVLSPADDLTTIRITISRGDDTYLPYVRRGSCAAYADQPRIPLALASADQPSATLVDLPYDELAAGGYVLDLHVATGTFDELLDPSTSVACGAIGVADSGSTGEAAAAVTAPVTGVGPLHGGAATGPLVGAAVGAALVFAVGWRLRRPLVYVRARVVRKRCRELLS